MGIHEPFGARELAPRRGPEPTEPHPTPIGDALGLSGLIVSGRALAQAPCCAARVSPICRRRNVLAATAMFALSSSFAPLCRAGAAPAAPDKKWFEAAAAMRKMAESWGDQAYGAVVVLDGQLVGEGPSRVIKNQDPDAHAEREAIRDAQRRLGKADLTGAVMYSTSRPCSRCEAAAARAKLSRMFFGADLADAGAPRAAQEQQQAR